MTAVGVSTSDPQILIQYIEHILDEEIMFYIEVSKKNLISNDNRSPL